MNPVKPGMDMDFNGSEFSVVYIPTDMEQPLAEWKFTWGDGSSVQHKLLSVGSFWH